MKEPEAEDGTLAHHLTHLAASSDDLAEFLGRSHEAAEIHPEALVKSERLSTSLKEVIHALTHHDHLAMTSDDVWKALTIKHEEGDDGALK